MWAKMDDGILDNPKVLSVGPIGFALYVAGIAWSARNMTDGFIPAAKVGTLLELRGVFVNAGNPSGFFDGEDIKGGAASPDALDVAHALVQARLWKVSAGGFKIHDFLEYNPSKASMAEKRAAGNARQSRYMQRHADGVNDASGDTSDDASSPGSGSGVLVLGSKGGVGGVFDAFEAWWAEYPRHVAKLAARKAWQAIDPTPWQAAVLMAAVRAQRLAAKEPRFIPHPATWLNGARYVDDPEPPSRLPTAASPARPQPATMVIPSAEETRRRMAEWDRIARGEAK